MIKLKVFGQLTDIIESEEIVLESSSLDDLKKELIRSYPILEKYSYQFSVNHEIVFENKHLNPEDEIAILPPFAGG